MTTPLLIMATLGQTAGELQSSLRGYFQSASMMTFDYSWKSATSGPNWEGRLIRQGDEYAISRRKMDLSAKSSEKNESFYYTSSGRWRCQYKTDGVVSEVQILERVPSITPECDVLLSFGFYKRFVKAPMLVDVWIDGMNQKLSHPVGSQNIVATFDTGPKSGESKVWNIGLFISANKPHLLTAFMFRSTTKPAMDWSIYLVTKYDSSEGFDYASEMAVFDASHAEIEKAMTTGRLTPPPKHGLLKISNFSPRANIDRSWIANAEKGKSVVDRLTGDRVVGTKDAKAVIDAGRSSAEEAQKALSDLRAKSADRGGATAVPPGSSWQNIILAGLAILILGGACYVAWRIRKGSGS